MTVKRPKTENDLDERFQWNKDLSPDHIFEEELEMIKKLRKQIPELELENDKFVAVFLFARRHGIIVRKKRMGKGRGSNTSTIHATLHPLTHPLHYILTYV
jgi:hypothetical protein